MKFNELSEFKKDRKKLERKYKSLADDLRQFQAVVSAMPAGNGKHFSVITRTRTLQIIKARFFCRYLKGSSLRIVYACLEETRCIEFIEVYHKENKTNEDRARIKKYLTMPRKG